MSAREKSDLPVGAEKRANKAASAAAELVERRGGAKENAELQSTVRTQSRAAVSQAQARIREAVARNRQDKLTALLHHLSVDVLRASFFGLKKSAVPGVDEMTWTEYAEGLEENLSDLHSRVQTGAYRALPSRGEIAVPTATASSAASKCYRLVASKPERFNEVRPGNDDGV
jgi:RNA-directed DNA polymerase